VAYLNFNCRIEKLKDFSRSQAVLYTVKVVITNMSAATVQDRDVVATDY